jgi:GT2 family glycosyltransferase
MKGQEFKAYPDIAIIVLNWNGREFLKICLDSLRTQTFKGFKVILVDNGSTDGSVEFVRENYPEVAVIALDKNYGFAKGNNVGIEEALKNKDIKYIALLNNDTEATPYWLGELIQALDNNTDVGFCTSKMLRFYNRQIIDEAGHAFCRYGFAYKIGVGEEDKGQYDNFRMVFGACAGAVMYRRAMLEEIGLFDEDFFAYCEDIDLDFRAQLQGYKCLYVPTAVIYHIGGGTAKWGSAKCIYLSNRNRITVLLKNMPLFLFLKNFFGILWVELKTAIQVIFLKPHRRIMLKGGIDALRQLPKTLKKRRKIQQSRKVSNKYIESLFIEGDEIYKRRKRISWWVWWQRKKLLWLQK